MRVRKYIVSFAVNRFAASGVSRRRGGNGREIERIDGLRLTKRIAG